MHDAATEAGAGAALCPGVHRLHALAWQPGEFLHEDWWRRLDLGQWRDDYQRHPGCRRALDALIVQRRGFPSAALPGALTEQQLRLLGLEERLPTLLVALGLIARRQPDLLLLRSFRRHFADVLGESGCEQLAALMPCARGPWASVEPEHAVDDMRRLGQAWLDASMRTSAVWQAMAIRLSPPEVPPDRLPDGPALPVLFRLERLL